MDGNIRGMACADSDSINLDVLDGIGGIDGEIRRGREDDTVTAKDCSALKFPCAFYLRRDSNMREIDGRNLLPKTQSERLIDTLGGVITMGCDGECTSQDKYEKCHDNKYPNP